MAGWVPMDINCDFLGLLCRTQGIEMPAEVLDPEPEQQQSVGGERKRSIPDWSRFVDLESPIVSVQSLVSKPAVSEKHPIAVLRNPCSPDREDSPGIPEKRKKVEEGPEIDVCLENLHLQTETVNLVGCSSEEASVVKEQSRQADVVVAAQQVVTDVPAESSGSPPRKSPAAMDEGSDGEFHGTFGWNKEKQQSITAPAPAGCDVYSGTNPKPNEVNVPPTSSFNFTFSPVQPPRFRFSENIAFQGRRNSVQADGQADTDQSSAAPAQPVAPQESDSQHNSDIVTPETSRIRHMGHAASKGAKKSILKKSTPKRLPSSQPYFSVQPVPKAGFKQTVQEPGRPLTPPPEDELDTTHDMTFVAMADLSISDSEDSPPDAKSMPILTPKPAPVLARHRPATPLMLQKQRQVMMARSQQDQQPNGYRLARRLPMLLQLKQRSESDVASPAAAANIRSLVEQRKAMTEAQRLKGRQRPSSSTADQDEEVDEETRSLLLTVENKSRNQRARDKRIFDHVQSRISACNKTLHRTPDDLAERAKTLQQKKKHLNVQFGRTNEIRYFEKDPVWLKKQGVDPPDNF